MPEPNFNCDYCGNAGYNSPSRMKRNHKNFCSKDCSNKYRSKKIEVFCNCCGSDTLKSVNQLVKGKKLFCSLDCSYKYKDKRVKVSCEVCNKLFLKQKFEIGRTKKNCCSKECSLLLAKFHKNWGSSRSKLEVAIEAYLKNNFLFHIDYNKNKIGYELDIHVPHLELAIEINGILHYKAIFGIEKLLRTQKTDREKVLECKKRNIKLVVINVSKDRGSKKIQNQRIEEVVKIIGDRIQELIKKSELAQFSMTF
jgi:hypothetical protein